MPTPKRVVYILKNSELTARYYVGLTSDARARLDDHNAGRCPHTVRYRPWQLHVVIEFPDEARAIRFERYLKSGPDGNSLNAISTREEVAHGTS